MSMQSIGETMRRLDRCRWCNAVAVLTDTDGELLCPDCRAVIFLQHILSAVPDTNERK